MGISGPPHVETANMAPMAMTSAPVEGESQGNVETESWARTRDKDIGIVLEIAQGLSKA